MSKEILTGNELTSGATVYLSASGEWVEPLQSARLAAARGYDLVLTYRSDTARAEETAHACEAAGAKVVLLMGEAAAEADIVAAYDVAQASFGRIDGVVNNAGTTGGKRRGTSWSLTPGGPSPRLAPRGRAVDRP